MKLENVALKILRWFFCLHFHCNYQDNYRALVAPVSILFLAVCNVRAQKFNCFFICINKYIFVYLNIIFSASHLFNYTICIIFAFNISFSAVFPILTHCENSRALW